jgi:hypothetical protein
MLFQAAVVMFDMIEYYEAATHLNISSNNEIMVRGWQACQRMLKKVFLFTSYTLSIIINSVNVRVLKMAGSVYY